MTTNQIDPGGPIHQTIRTTRRFRLLLILVAFAMTWLSACASSDDQEDRVGFGDACVDGQSRPCSCPNGGAPSSERCTPSGQFGACECSSDALPKPNPAAPAGPASCGDGKCDEAASETCRSCAAD